MNRNAPTPAGRSDRPEGGWTIGLLALPLLCCGLPLLLAAGGGLVAWAALRGVVLGAVTLAVVVVAALLVGRARRSAASACAVCAPDRRKEGRRDADPAEDQRHALS